MQGLDVAPSRKRGRSDYPAFWDKYISALSKCQSGGEFDPPPATSAAAPPPVDETLASLVVDLFPPDEAADPASAQPAPFFDLFPEETLAMQSAAAAASEAALARDFDAMLAQWQRDRAHAQSGGTFGDDDYAEVPVDSDERPTSEEIMGWWRAFWTHVAMLPDSAKPGYAPGQDPIYDYDASTWRSIVLRQYLKRKKHIDALAGRDTLVEAANAEPVRALRRADGTDADQDFTWILRHLYRLRLNPAWWRKSPAERRKETNDLLLDFVREPSLGIRRQATRRALAVPLPEDTAQTAGEFPAEILSDSRSADAPRADQTNLDDFFARHSDVPAPWLGVTTSPVNNLLPPSTSADPAPSAPIPMAERQPLPAPQREELSAVEKFVYRLAQIAMFEQRVAMAKPSDKPTTRVVDQEAWDALVQQRLAETLHSLNMTPDSDKPHKSVVDEYAWSEEVADGWRDLLRQMDESQQLGTVIPEYVPPINGVPAWLPAFESFRRLARGMREAEGIDWDGIKEAVRLGWEGIRSRTMYEHGVSDVSLTEVPDDVVEQFETYITEYPNSSKPGYDPSTGHWNAFKWKELVDLWWKAIQTSYAAQPVPQSAGDIADTLMARKPRGFLSSLNDQYTADDVRALSRGADITEEAAIRFLRVGPYDRKDSWGRNRFGGENPPFFDAEGRFDLQDAIHEALRLKDNPSYEHIFHSSTDPFNPWESMGIRIQTSGEYGEVLTGQRGLSAEDMRAMYEDLVAAISYLREHKMGSSLSMYQLLRDLAKLAWHMKSRGITPWSTSKAKSAGDFATIRSAAACSGGYSKQIKKLVDWLKSFIWSSDSNASDDSRLRRRERDGGLRVWSVRGESDLEGGL